LAFDLSSLKKGKRVRAPRIVVLGVEKIGKSTFAAGAPKPVFIPIIGEEGIDDLDVTPFPTANSFQDVLDYLGALAQQEHDHQTVVIDSASALEPLIWRHTCARNDNAETIEKVGGGYGKGFTEALTEWDMILRGLDWLRSQKNMASIIVGHVQVRRFDDPTGLSYDQYQFDVNQKAANKLFRWADSILFCNTKVVVKQEKAGFGKDLQKGIDITEGQRFLYTQKRPAHPGGGRGIYGQLPYELPLSWGDFQQAMMAGANS
jgi:hypothetical protein